MRLLFWLGCKRAVYDQWVAASASLRFLFFCVALDGVRLASHYADLFEVGFGLWQSVFSMLPLPFGYAVLQIWSCNMHLANSCGVLPSRVLNHCTFCDNREVKPNAPDEGVRNVGGPMGLYQRKTQSPIVWLVSPCCCFVFRLADACLA